MIREELAAAGDAILAGAEVEDVGAFSWSTMRRTSSRMIRSVSAASGVGKLE
jgi:hypothetical protein